MFFFSFISHKECFGFSCLHCCGRRLGSADGWHSCSRRIMWTKHFQFETNKRSSLWRNRVVRRSGGWGCGGGGEASVRSDRLLPLLLARPPLLHLHLHLHTGANNSQLFWSRKWWHKLNHLLLRVQANIALKLTIFSRLDSPAPFVLAESGHLNFKLDSPHIVRNWVNFVTAPTLPQLFQYFYAALDDFTQFIIIEVPKRDFRKGKFGFCLCCPVLIIWKWIKLYYIHYIGIADF